jgi:two-component system, NarL family, nitrate/nitrite response regulator NarL
VVGIAIVGGSTLCRESLRRVLDDTGGLKVVGAAAALQEEAQLIGRVHPDVLVVDLERERDLPSLASFSHRHPSVRVVALGVDDDEVTVVACAEAGVVGYLPRETNTAELVQAIKQVARGELVCPPRIVETLVRWHSRRAGAPTNSLLDDLTGREREVVELVELGLSNKQIAERLCIAVATVKSHVHSILGKLNVERRAEVGALLRDAGR